LAQSSGGKIEIGKRGGFRKKGPEEKPPGGEMGPGDRMGREKLIPLQNCQPAIRGVD
jgi:hypothetical protein